ncbi:MAG TPA: biotin--[acetyl-CoA-carboxylase] ligase [Burkholderiaceae bacterium]|nr:biotin--[acetyl-CoA-carboxylase] ligase [Burkholderiaceae bacterium]
MSLHSTGIAPVEQSIVTAPPLSPSAIQRWLDDADPAEPIDAEVRAAIGSTNEELLARARLQQPAVVQLLAVDEQSAGRGRQRRPWLARPRSALLFSLAVPLPELLPGLPAVTPACGVALAELLIARGLAITLKWPNDLLLGGRKLGGVLCELAVDDEGRATLVIGVGINVFLTDDDRERIGQPSAALADALPGRLLAGEREAWIAGLAMAVLQTVRRFAVEGFAPWRKRCNALLQSRNEPVDIVDDGRVLASGRAIDVDASGRLVLETASGLRSIQVGDVSLRRPSGGQVEQ